MNREKHSPTIQEAADWSAAAAIRRSLARHEAGREIVAAGAWVQGVDPGLDAALTAAPSIDSFLAQPGEEACPFGETLERLARLAGEVGA